MSVRLRASVAADVPAMYDVWKTAVQATHDFLSDDDFREISRLVENDFLPSRTFTVAVDAEDRPIGFLSIDGDEIEALFVHADQRGRGVGKALLAAALERLSAPVVEVNEQNVQAVGFYEAFGFRTFKRAPDDGHGRPYPILRMRRV